MRVAIVTMGTRGDVQPYVAIGRALRERGHEVVIGVDDDHAAMIRAHGLEHRRAGGSFRALLETDLGRAWLTSADSPRKYAKYARELFGPLQQAWCEDADRAVEGCDGVAFYALATGALHAAERRKLPAIALTPWPLAPTRAHAPVVAPWLEAMPGLVKLGLGHLIMRFAFSTFNDAHDAYRARVGLRPYRAKDVLHFVLESGVPTIQLFSEAVLPRPRDWAERHRVAGFSFLPNSNYEPPTTLAEFMNNGPPPVYLGFGSMTGFEPGELAGLAARAARLAGVRVVIGSGWAGLAPRPSEDVFVVDELPHDWLFPRVAAVVHHGGVGTFAEGLRAGKPTVIAAFFGDQPFWGRINERLGTGPRALRRDNLTAKALAAAIRAALNEPGYRARAVEVSRRIREEDGAARAAELIERHLTATRG